jgi:hypothetical protein
MNFYFFTKKILNVISSFSISISYASKNLSLINNKSFLGFNYMTKAIKIYQICYGYKIKIASLYATDIYEAGTNIFYMFFSLKNDDQYILLEL